MNYSKKGDTGRYESVLIAIELHHFPPHITKSLKKSTEKNSKK